ncbi:MAG: hypothetical protein ABI673_08225 [Novosphingobium sp.]
MTEQRIDQALSRIESAASRIEAAAARLAADNATAKAEMATECGDLAARHERLRSVVSQSLRDLDALIGSDPLAGDLA